MHSCELITNLRAEKVLCHRVEVVKNFQCYNHRLCFLQCDWLSSNSSWKSNQLNKPEESAKGHQTLFPRERAGSGHETTVFYAYSVVRRGHGTPLPPLNLPLGCKIEEGGLT